MNDDKNSKAASPSSEAKKGASDAAGKAAGGSNKAIWMGTAVGIGSAAIVAALLYARRRK